MSRIDPEIVGVSISLLGDFNPVHFRVDSQETRNRLGTALAPLEPWGPWRDRLNLGDRHGGMTSLQMSQTKPADRNEGGRIDVVVEPSSRVGRDSGTGVYVRVDDSFVGDGDAKRLVAILAREFEESVGRSERIVDHFMSLACLEE